MRMSLLSHGLSLISVLLLLASSPMAFSQAVGGPEDTSNGESWAIEMEQRVWAALGAVDISFNAIDSVECAYPTCRIAYHATDSSRAKINRLTQYMGKDHQGLPLVKQRSIVHRELSPDFEAVFIILTTSDPRFEAQMVEACQRAKEANLPTPLGMTCDP